MNQAFLKQHFCREKIYISGKMHLFICTLQIRAKNFKEYRFYCSDGYGTMLWNLRSDYCEKYLKLNFCTKITFLRTSTHRQLNCLFNYSIVYFCSTILFLDAFFVYFRLEVSFFRQTFHI